MSMLIINTTLIVFFRWVTIGIRILEILPDQIPATYFLSTIRENKLPAMNLLYNKSREIWFIFRSYYR